MVLEALLPFALLPLRVMLGIIFVVHGLPKIKGLAGDVSWLAGLGIKPARFWFVILALTEFIGGIAMIAGAFVQIVAALQCISMLVALYANAIAWKKPFKGGYELDLLLIAGLLAMLVLGAGPYSVDATFGLSFF